MAQQIINIGTAPNDGTGDPLRTAMTKANANFAELYNFSNITPRVFLASTTYPVTTSTAKVLAYAKGAGAGGGNGVGGAGAFGGGGGEGAESWLWTTAAALSGLAVTVGAGGVQDAAGGTSSIGALITAFGGQPGAQATFGGAGGAGGNGGARTHGMPGAPGQSGGSGGGKGGGPSISSAATNSGGGGGGGNNVNSAGNGASGIVFCYEFGVI